MGIAFPRKEKSDRIKNLNKMILDRFEDTGTDEFYKWAKSIHGTVIESMPANVETKMMAFTDSAAVANDRITGEASIVAFRATALNDGVADIGYFPYFEPGMEFGLFIIDEFKQIFLVVWKKIDYNFGNYFDGTNFNVPENGLYTFHVSCQQKSNNSGTVYLYLNDIMQTSASKVGKSNATSAGTIKIQITLKLTKDDIIYVRFESYLYNTSSEENTYFEGRLIAKINE